MGDFGADEGRYAVHHNWADRLPRDADLGQARHGGDMRLAVFHYPIEGWTDAVVMNVLQGLATGVQHERTDPRLLCPAGRRLPRDRTARTAPRRTGLRGPATDRLDTRGQEGRTGSNRLLEPAVATTFGVVGSSRFDTLRKFGLRHTSNEELLAQWENVSGEKLGMLGL